MVLIYIVMILLIYNLRIRFNWYLWIIGKYSEIYQKYRNDLILNRNLNIWHANIQRQKLPILCNGRLYYIIYYIHYCANCQGFPEYTTLNNHLGVTIRTADWLVLKREVRCTTNALYCSELGSAEEITCVTRASKTFDTFA